ncbi:ATP-binding protein [Nocardioides agariphilus]|uniref:ATP-binding protein n=1 Tax=Nocardioides agariphilus TaxID=433664 RepID=A0A930VKK1_9ACTN|nr:ATP-binding protein [Nocardioides agariphilus]
MSAVADVTGSSLQVTASLDVLAEVRAFVRSTAAGLGADTDTVSALVQCVDEWVTNVVVHGYRGPGPVEVSFGREGADIVVDIRDAAPAFDPATARPFDPDVPLERRPFGGMGIALINDLCTVFEHRSLSGGASQAGNVVTMRRPAHTAANDGGQL